MNKRKIDLIPYTPLWKEYYLKECQVLEKILKNNCKEVHHIGSTAIKKIMAKPILDILCVVHTLDKIDAFKYEFEKMGLKWMGENGLPGRLYFIRLAKDGVTHLSHIHIFEKSNTLINDHLDFRDYLNAEDQIAIEYEELKVTLQKNYLESPELYTAGKNEFIKTVLKSINNKTQKSRRKS